VSRVARCQGRPVSGRPVSDLFWVARCQGSPGVRSVFKLKGRPVSDLFSSWFLTAGGPGCATTQVCPAQFRLVPSTIDFVPAQVTGPALPDDVRSSTLGHD
jgi:hypothetical protein